MLSQGGGHEQTQERQEVPVKEDRDADLRKFRIFGFEIQSPERGCVAAAGIDDQSRREFRAIYSARRC